MGSVAGTLRLRVNGDPWGGPPRALRVQVNDSPPLTLTLQPGDWPAFRGPNRDNHLPGVRIATDWQQHPPRQVWRHRIGPGWSVNR